MKNETPKAYNILVFPEKKLLLDGSYHFNVYKEDDVNDTKYKDDNISSASIMVSENNEHDYIEKSIASEEREIRSQNLLKKHIKKKFTEDNLRGCSSIRNHTRRLKDIEDAYLIFDKYKQDDKKYKSCFETADDSILLKNLFKFFEGFDKSLTFDQDSCLKFLGEFNFKLFYTLHSLQLREILARLSNERRKIVFYSELMRLYRYAVNIPELLTLGGLYLDESSRKVVFTMHLINLFIENVYDVKENRTFIMFLIYKTFNSYYGKNFDMFRIPHYELELCDLKHDFTFFTWELTTKKRQNIRKRYNDIKYNYSDKKCLKIVLLLFIYQHTIFIKYYDINAENVSIFTDFIEKVIQSESCVGCLFNEYLSIIQRSIKNMK